MTRPASRRDQKRRLVHLDENVDDNVDENVDDENVDDDDNGAERTIGQDGLARRPFPPHMRADSLGRSCMLSMSP